MHLSAQEEYGLRCLIQLARHDGQKPLRIQDIAASEGLSFEYVAKLVRILRKAGLARSTRGAGGGYRLGRAAHDINLWEAVQSLGEPFFRERFCDDHTGLRSDCVHTDSCSIRGVWRGVNELLQSSLSAVTLADITGGGERATYGWLASRDYTAEPRTSGEPSLVEATPAQEKS